MNPITFVVYGKPVPAGSKTPWNPRCKDGSLVLRHDGRPVIATMDSTKVRGRDWKQAVASAAREAYQGELLDGSLFVQFTFYLPRPKGHFGTGRKAAALKDSAPQFPATKPDVLKLSRAVEDALTGVLWRDDSQIVTELLEKRFGEPARVEIAVSPMLTWAKAALAPMELFS